MIPSLIRTYVPLLVAYLVGWLASLGIDLSGEQQTALTGVIGTVVAAVYYAAVRWAERRWPALSLLLGSGKQPATYSPDGSLSVGSVTLADPDQPAAGVPPRADG